MSPTMKLFSLLAIFAPFRLAFGEYLRSVANADGKEVTYGSHIRSLSSSLTLPLPISGNLGLKVPVIGTLPVIVNQPTSQPTTGVLKVKISATAFDIVLAVDTQLGVFTQCIKDDPSSLCDILPPNSISEQGLFNNNKYISQSCPFSIEGTGIVLNSPTQNYIFSSVGGTCKIYGADNSDYPNYSETVTVQIIS